ncbi:MAG: glycosyltransferase family 87 protein [Bacteroidota bacterium]
MKEHFRDKWPYYTGGLILLMIILFEAQGKGDFDIFLSASRDLLLGKNIYTIQYHEWYHYYYDIFFALALVPLTYLPLYFAKLIWLILNVFFVLRLWKIIMGWLPLSCLRKSSVMVFKILSFVIILRFLRDNFHLAQVTIFILYLTFEGLFLINSNRRIAGSLLIALGIDVKLLPIVIIPYLLYRNEWKSALYIIGFILVLICLPIVVIGFDYNKFLLAERWNLINPMNQAHILDTSERSFHSLTTLLSTLLVKDCGDYYALPLKRNIADVSVETLNIVINIVRGALILFTLYFLRTKPFTKISGNLQRLYELSYLCIVIPLIFPHQQHYAFFFIFPATTYLLFYLVDKYFNKENYLIIKHFKIKKITLIVFMSIVYFLTNSHFILGEFTNYYDHYKTLTYGVLILIILLAICKPDKLSHT